MIPDHLSCMVPQIAEAGSILPFCVILLSILLVLLPMLGKQCRHYIKSPHSVVTFGAVACMACLILGIACDADCVRSAAEALLYWLFIIVSGLLASSAVGRCAQVICCLYVGAALPAWLRSVLGVLEYISCACRSISLALRILCNTAAGHVLLGLVTVSTILVGTLATLEFVAAAIQADVLHKLISNYIIWLNPPSVIRPIVL
jgi:F0F1-type ATP synthase membrane subunit a